MMTLVRCPPATGHPAARRHRGENDSRM